MIVLKTNVQVITVATTLVMIATLNGKTSYLTEESDVIQNCTYLMAVDLIDSTTGSTASFVCSYAFTVLLWMSSLRSGKNVRTKVRKICTCKLNSPWMAHQVVMAGRRQSQTPNDTDPFTNFFTV